jgi:hypothetical protein
LKQHHQHLQAAPPFLGAAEIAPRLLLCSQHQQRCFSYPPYYCWNRYIWYYHQFPIMSSGQLLPPPHNFQCPAHKRREPVDTPFS